MSATGFWWILLATTLYGALHSVLAANRVKALVERWIGSCLYQRWYRLLFSLQAGLTFLPVLALVAALPDRTIYTIPAPWVYLTLALQGLALVGILVGVLQTGAMSFLGIRQLVAPGDPPCGPMPEKLVVTGLYRRVRHPLYAFSYLLIWLVPTMTWNLLALNLGLSAYLWIGSIFEERKLAEQFGQAYLAYKKRTPRIIPGAR
jgi:protein-S-isoprenylcysteine O-methyltransferase Ste14